MEGATHREEIPPARITPAHALRARVVAVPWPGLLLLALAVVMLIGFFVYPTYPNYDSYYSLIWGRELLHGQTPSFDVYRAPTEHPLGVFFGAALSLFGQGADRLMIFFSLATLVVLAAGIYRLGRLCFTPLVGVLAAALMLSRFDFPFLAIRGYIDVPYLAAVIWAGALEVERPRRGMPVLLLLVLAGLMRPEAWILIGLYYLWIAWPMGWTDRIKYAAISAIAPVVWAGLDYAVTGDPAFSLHHTSGLAEDLGRQKSLTEVPGSMAHFLVNLDKIPILAVGVAGIVIAGLLMPKRGLVPGALLVVGLGTFLLLGAGGFSVIDRYLLVSSVMFMVFAAVAIGGWTMLRKGRWRTAWMVAALVAVIGGGAFTATRINLTTFENELSFRAGSHDSLVQVLGSKAVQDAWKCGPVSTPNHKIVPDTRWILGADATAERVQPRSDPAVNPYLHPTGPLSKGVALYATNRAATLRNAFTTSDDDTAVAALPLPGFDYGFGGTYYGAYVHCGS
jgi:hypothetical protein